LNSETNRLDFADKILLVIVVTHWTLARAWVSPFDDIPVANETFWDGNFALSGANESRMVVCIGGRTTAARRIAPKIHVCGTDGTGRKRNFNRISMTEGGNTDHCNGERKISHKNSYLKVKKWT
jgi:hypothetical protein